MATRIIIGISGASGFQYGVKALELLRPHPVEVHLVVSKGAEKNLRAGDGLPPGRRDGAGRRGVSHRQSWGGYLQRFV